MNLNQLNAFCTLARTLHYSRAAEELEIAQPSLSRMISHLEEELGTNLFEKRGRNIILSKQGELFYFYVNRGLKDIKNGTTAINEMLHPGHGTIDFAFIYALSPTYIPKMIRKFLDREENKNIGFRFYQMNSVDIIHKLKEGGCDLGLCSYVENEPLIHFRPIALQEYVLMVSKDHPLANRKSITLEEASRYDFILPLEKTSYVEEQFRNAGLTPHVTSRVEEDHAAAALVSINLGIAIIPKNKILEQYNVKQLSFEPKPLYRKFYMARVKDKQFTPAAAVFYRFLGEESKKELPVF